MPQHASGCQKNPTHSAASWLSPPLCLYCLCSSNIPTMKNCIIDSILCSILSLSCYAHAYVSCLHLVFHIDVCSLCPPSLPSTFFSFDALLLYGLTWIGLIQRIYLTGVKLHYFMVCINRYLHKDHALLGHEWISSLSGLDQQSGLTPLHGLGCHNLLHIHYL